MPILKTLHITNYYHKNSGGISTSYNNLLAAAGKMGRHARLIVPGAEDSVEIVNDFAKIYFVSARYSPIFDNRYRVMMPWQYMVKDSAIRKILLEEMPDLIEVTDKYTLSMIGAMIRTNNFKRLGRPILVHFSCERMDDNISSFLFGGPIASWFSRMLFGNYLLPSFDFHIANSSYTAAEFIESAEKATSRFSNLCWRFLRGPRYPLAERLFVCPRGVDAEHFRPERRSQARRAQIIDKAGISDDSVILLYAGRLSPEKNVGLLLEMMERLRSNDGPDFRLLIAGDGPLRSKIAERGKRDLNGRIILLGHLDKEQLADYYANADVFVHPNPREPFGIAPLEAMASGVPTLAPRSGGILSYATNENAWLVEPKGEAFAAAVREIISNPEARAEKVSKAIETARNNTREHATTRLFETYDRIAEIFDANRGLFTDAEAARTFDFAKFLKSGLAKSVSEVNEA
jgi:glycosyltransferase involved in cell wall biosynthesis